MDEPFGALDPVTRAELQREFSALAKRLGKTIVFVTLTFAKRSCLRRASSCWKKGASLPTLLLRNSSHRSS